MPYFQTEHRTLNIDQPITSFITITASIEQLNIPFQRQHSNEYSVMKADISFIITIMSNLGFARSAVEQLNVIQSSLLDHEQSEQLCNPKVKCITRRIMFLKHETNHRNMILPVMYSTFGLHNFFLSSMIHILLNSTFQLSVKNQVVFCENQMLVFCLRFSFCSREQ